MVGTQAQAEQFDTLNLSTSLSQQYDSNLFRLPADITPRPLVGKPTRNERITTGTVGIELRKSWSLQQVDASVEHTSRRYDTYSFLDNDTLAVRGAWRWHITPGLGGNLSYDRSAALVGFSDYRNYAAQNMRTTTRQRFDIDWNIFHGGWHLVGGTDRITIRNSKTFSQDEGSSVTSADIGLRYTFPSTNWIELSARAGSGAYDRPLSFAAELDDRFSERRTVFRLHWLPSGKTTLDASLGHLARQHDHFGGRDYDGGIADIKWSWAASAKLALTVSARRNLAVYTDAASSYYVMDAVSLAPIWSITPKLSLSLNLDRNQRSFRGPITSLPYTPRDDRTDLARLVTEWAPSRGVTISGYLAVEQRDSRLASASYEDKLAGASIRLQF